MTPKEKAKELINRYLKILAGGMYDVREEAKQCALIAVDEIIQSCLETTKLYESNDIINSDLSCQPIGYYEEVKIEIEKLCTK
jgi:hypothetical protein